MGFRTQAQVDRVCRHGLPEGKADAYVWDDEQPGLSIRLKGAARTWTVWYQVNGTRRKVALGAVGPGMPLKEARQRAGRIVADARDGKDPLEDRAAAKAKAADTFGGLVKLYLERRAKPRQRPRTYIETERALLKRWAPLHDRPVASVTRRDVAARLEEIRIAHGPIAANRARVYLGGCYSWAMRQGLVDFNPIIGTEAPSVEIKRDRVLSPAELVAVWRACGGRGEFGTIVRLLMLTGARREEVSGLRWPELDLEGALWTLPAARSKNGREHEVPLPRQAVAMFSAREQAGEFVFGRRGRGPFSGYSQAKERLDIAIATARAKEAGHDPEKVELKEWLPPAWRLHDLRRSAVTHMVETLEIAPHVVEAAINHVSGHKGGVAGVYNRATYRPQKKAALQAWADHLEALAAGQKSGTNVVPLRG